jgi:histidine ammonia-lyase
MSRITILKEEFGNLNVRQIKPAMVETFQHNILQRKSVRTGKQYAPATANRILEILKRIFNLAMREDMTEKNP